MEEMDDLEDEFALRKLIEAVENQIADGHPRESGLVMMELLAKGVSRKDALQGMAEVLAEEIAETFKTDKPFDINSYSRKLLMLVTVLDD